MYRQFLFQNSYLYLQINLLLIYFFYAVDLKGLLVGQESPRQLDD